MEIWKGILSRRSVPALPITITFPHFPFPIPLSPFPFPHSPFPSPSHKKSREPGCRLMGGTPVLCFFIDEMRQGAFFYFTVAFMILSPAGLTESFSKRGEYLPAGRSEST